MEHCLAWRLHSCECKTCWALLLEKIRNFFGLMAWSIVLHEDFTAVNVKHAEHVLLQHFYIQIAIHFFFVFRQEIQASPAHFPRKNSLWHDWIRVLYSWDCEPRVKSIRGMRASNHRGSHSEHLKITLIRKHNSFPLCRRPVNIFFANAMRCFFIRSVKSGFLAALRLGKPKPFCRRCCMVRTATFSSSSGCKFFSSKAVSHWFFCTSFLLKCPLRLMSSFFVHLQICAWGLNWEEALWLRLEASLLLTWFFHYEHTILFWKLSLVSRQEF